ncbi:MAG: molecular chaperone Skp [Ignavibacteriales bacterium CG_4_9_14_3_um_filter_30_11]|nr:MAG: molecular chaperone Skp [Ignavibacteriales bacterium CG_4_9_14_3_um_filter_30_11]
MKKYLMIIAAVFLLGAVSFAQTKVGFIDSQLILQQLPLAIKAQGDLDALTNMWSAHIDSLTKELQDDYTNYQKNAKTYDKAKLESEQKRLVTKQQVIDDYKKVKFGQPNGEIYKKNDEIFGPVKKQIYQAIQDVAKSENMQFIFDKAGDAILLYGDPTFDVTYKVLDKLKTSK